MGSRQQRVRGQRRSSRRQSVVSYAESDLQESAEEEEEEEEEEETAAVDGEKCTVCGSGDREDMLLLCDACDAGWHTDCLPVPLDCVPEGDWICPNCPAAPLDAIARGPIVTKLLGGAGQGAQGARIPGGGGGEGHGAGGGGGGWKARDNQAKIAAALAGRNDPKSVSLYLCGQHTRRLTC